MENEFGIVVQFEDVGLSPKAIDHYKIMKGSE